MDKFVGDKILLDKYNEIANDLKNTYDNGVSLCFAGKFGVGKTLTVTNILKRAVEKGYSCLYATLSDIVTCTVNSLPEDRGLARKELLNVDFLVIDELDPRHIGSEAGADMFGRILEDIFRTRAQNKMPIFICTNAIKPVESFTGAIKLSIESLFNYVTMVPVLGSDFRKIEAKVAKGNG
jgi:DNA replication protein DnaC